MQRLRRLLLGLGRTVKSIPLPHNSAFPGGQSVHQRTQPGGVGAALAAGLHVGFIGQGVRQRQLPVRLERLLQRQRHSRPPPPPQIHAEFILNTSARIAGKALALGGVEGIHRLDKPNRADGDHVVLCAVPGIVFFADMRDEPQIVADQRIPRLCGGCPALLQIGKGRVLPVRRERTREGPAFEMQRQIQNMPCRRLQKQTKNAQHTHHLAEVYAGHGNSILSFGWQTPGWRRTSAGTST